MNAAAIPIAMNDARAMNLMRTGDVVIFSGFRGGINMERRHDSLLNPTPDHWHAQT